MSLPVIKYCPGTLAEGFNSYSPACLRQLFGGKKVSHILPYESSQRSEETNELFIDNRKRISISGVQEKLSLVQEKNVLRLTLEGEVGTHILKPIPRDLKKVDQVPANEHLTLQIAKQVYKIPVAENALIFFKDGSPVYITRRFDIREDGKKRGKEDFATLAGKTKINSGANFKYEYSYEELGWLIQKYVPAWKVEIEKYFSVVVFNFLFSNGDAHLKNFSLIESQNGDYILSPAYDLINTRLYVDDNDFALSNGLFVDEYKSDSYKKNRHPSKEDFAEFGNRIGVQKKRTEKLLRPFLERQELVETLTKHSYMNEQSQRGYLLDYNTKRNFLND